MGKDKRLTWTQNLYISSLSSQRNSQDHYEKQPLKWGVQMRCYALLWVVVFPHHTKGSESNGYHWLLSNGTSKVSGGVELLPDLTLNLFVGHIPVLVTWIIEWWRKLSIKCCVSDLSCNYLGTQSRVAILLKIIAVLVISCVEGTAWL